MNKKLSDKIALITGGSRGIGKEIALSFAAEGADVCITYKSKKTEAIQVQKKIMEMGRKCLVFQLDITNRKDIQQVLSNIITKWKKIDILVNNAGILEQKSFFELTDNDWDRTLAVNLKGVFVCTQEISKIFKNQHSGCIINISSLGGQIGGTKAVDYAAAKSGIISLTKSSAKLLSTYNVRVNCIAPGFIRTDMFKQTRKNLNKNLNEFLIKRIGEPKDVANSAVFLASDDSSYVTGQIINVNGGIV